MLAGAARYCFSGLPNTNIRSFAGCVPRTVIIGAHGAPYDISRLITKCLNAQQTNLLLNSASIRYNACLFSDTLILLIP